MAKRWKNGRPVCEVEGCDKLSDIKHETGRMTKAIATITGMKREVLFLCARHAAVALGLEETN